MKITGFLSFLFCFLTSANIVVAQSTPNIILVIADDVGWDDIGCYGNTAIRTPNIDQLAKEGMRFTNTFVTSVHAVPAAAALLRDGIRTIPELQNYIRRYPRILIFFRNY